MKLYLHAFRNFTNFNGRASRTQYWMFLVFNTTFAILCYTVDLLFNIGFKEYGFGPFYLLYVIIAFLPGLALTVRRLHDVDRNGYFILIALLPVLGFIWLLVLFLMKGNEDENDYGEKPINENIGSFINDDKTNNSILIICLFWLLINKVYWIILSKYLEDFYKNEFFKQFNEIINSIWMFFPLLLSLTIKNSKWKIVLIICSMIYMVYSFYELVEAKLITTDNLQF